MRMWEIRENNDFREADRSYMRESEPSSKMDKNDKLLDEAYDCGYEAGYKKAMREFRMR